MIAHIQVSAGIDDIACGQCSGDGGVAITANRKNIAVCAVIKHGAAVAQCPGRRAGATGHCCTGHVCT